MDNMATAVSTDRIEKQVLLRAPQAKVWQAIADSQKFGEWFKVTLDGPFVAGQRVSGQITHCGYEHVKFQADVERVEPQSRLAFRWHPYQEGADYLNDPTTLVEFTLAPQDGGTLLTVVESGFDGLPPERRELTFRGNTRGWEGQLKSIQAYVEG